MNNSKITDSNRPSAAVRIRALKRDRYTCTYCGASGADVELEIDHIVPASKGGSNHISNLTTACKKCNLGKGNDQTIVPRQIKKTGTDSAGHGLVGLFFHTFVDNDKKRRQFHWQGQIRSVDEDTALVQLFSWVDGRPTAIKPMPAADLIAHATLYAYEDEWREAARQNLKNTENWA